MDPFICMYTMLNRILFEILNFTIFMIIPMMKILTLPLTVMFSAPLIFRIMRTVFSHQDLFKYHNVMFNLSNVTKIHFIPYLVDCLLTSLYERFCPPPSILVFQLLKSSKIIINHIFLKIMYIAVMYLLKLILSIMTHHAIIMVIHVLNYLLTQSH